MAAQGKLGAKVSQLKNLLGRGRRLHYQNAQVVVAKAAQLRLGARIPARADLVYRSLQLMFALTFLEERGYLGEAAYEKFTDALFAAVAGAESRRIYGLMQGYGGALVDGHLAQTFAQDLSSALVGKTTAALTQGFAAAPRAIQRTTQVYCATVFGDGATIRRLG